MSEPKEWVTAKEAAVRIGRARVPGVPVDRRRPSRVAHERVRRDRGPV